MIIRILSLIVLLFISFMVGYCGGKENGFHKLGVYFGILDNKKEEKHV